MSTDSEIIARSRDDLATFGVLFDRHATSIHRYVARAPTPPLPTT